MSETRRHAARPRSRLRIAHALVLALALLPQTAQGEGNILQKTQDIEVDGHIGPTRRFTQRLNGLCGQTCRNGPRSMYSTSFDDTLLVSWASIMEEDVTIGGVHRAANTWQHQGKVTTFKVTEDGEFTKVGDVTLPQCESVAGMTASADGSIIALLCRGWPMPETPSEGLLNLPGAIDLLATRRNPPTGPCPNPDWEGSCYPMGMYSEIDSPMYIFEYLGGEVTETPDHIVKVLHAVGGWNQGHHEISLNAAEDTYFVHLKNTLGPSKTNRHEGLKHFGIRRTPDFAYVNVTDGNACGPGHVLANRMVYNEAADAWTQLCTLDLCQTRHQYENGACRSVSWYTVPGVTKEPQPPHEGTELFSMDSVGGQFHYSGGGAAILSLGMDGWLALALGPGTPETEPKPETIGLLSLPLTVPELKEQGTEVRVPLYGTDEAFGTVTRYDWDWLDIPDPMPERARHKRAGFANMAYFSKDGEDSERLLVGWSPSTETQGITSEFVVSEVDRQGRLRGEALTLEAAGWGEDNLWVSMPNSGCVVFPFAWIGNAPGGNYPVEPSDLATYPTTLRLTSLCPGSAEQPPLAEPPAPSPAAATIWLPRVSSGQQVMRR
jgi:hypothetical protein